MRAKASSKIIAMAVAGLLLTACSGGGGDSDGGSGPGSPPPPPPPPPVTKIDTEPDAVRFLARATFGGTKAQVAAVATMDAADWLASEFAKPQTLTLAILQAQPRDIDGDIPRNRATELYWDHLITADDQLRQRMALALSQILVYSDISDQGHQERRAYYQDILIRNAFGNYRDLLQEVTYSPAMARWLTYWRNRKGDARTGRMPDENYAREVLQLFSIGLIELNMDGSPKLDAQGQQIETYTNDDIIGLARVFTGLTGKGTSFNTTDEDYNYNPLIMYDERHSPLEKVFLGTTIPANTGGTESVNTALDTIFAHPNVGPFLSRQLIQRLTHSSPSPAYVQRVATAFENGIYTAPNGRRFGASQRGDLEATLAAIMLDESLFLKDGDDASIVTKGKIREPILRFVHWARAFDLANIDASNEGKLRVTTDPITGLGQQPMRAPSVFNYYRPGYVAPGTLSGDRNLTTPEFQLVNEGTSVGYLNFMTEYAFDRAYKRDRDIATYKPDYSEEIALTSDIPALMTHLEILLTADRMTQAERDELIAILQLMPINTDTPEKEAVDREQIVYTAVALVLNSPSFAITW